MESSGQLMRSIHSKGMGSCSCARCHLHIQMMCLGVAGTWDMGHGLGLLASRIHVSKRCFWLGGSCLLNMPVKTWEQVLVVWPGCKSAGSLLSCFI